MTNEDRTYPWWVGRLEHTLRAVVEGWDGAETNARVVLDELNEWTEAQRVAS